MTLKHYCNYIFRSRDLEDIQKTQIELLEMKTTMSEKKNTQIGSISN